MSLREELAAHERLGDIGWLISKFDEVNLAYVDFKDRTEAAETLNIWSQRLSRGLLAQNIISEQNMQMILAGSFLSSFEKLLYLMIDRWSNGDPSYILACRKSMQHMLKVREQISDQTNIPSIIPSLTMHAAEYARDDARIAFGSLEAMARSSVDNCIKVRESLPAGFFKDSLKHLVSDPDRSGMIGRCLVFVLGTRSEPSDWFQFTLPYIGDLASYQALMTYFVEPMFKHNSNAERSFSQFIELCSSQSSPSVEVGALKAAKNAKLDVSRHILQSAAVTTSLSCLSRNLRFDALILLCCATRKLTTPLPSIIFDSIIHNAHCLLAEGEPRARAEVVGSFQNLFDRVKTSKSVPNARELVNFLVGWCAQSLTPGMPYRCLSMATKLLELLRSNGFEEQVYSPDVLRGLVNCIVSDFADIRESCVLLLDFVPKLPQVDSHFDEMTQHAFRIISGGRTGDSGARLLEFLNNRRPEANLGDQLEQKLELLVKDAQRDLAEASKSHRIYGFLIALKQVPPRSRHIMPTIIEVWDVCLGPLMSTAPEGSSEDLSNYCWKAVKESSLLVEALSLRLSPSSNGTFDSVPISLILDKLAYMLTSITHWGAFSAVPPAYIAIAKMNHEKASSLVWAQLDELKLRLKSRSVTRRSAGLPLLVTSTLSVHFDDRIVDAMFDLANLPFADGELDELEMPQVHGMNCIRAVLTDASLSKNSAKFIEKSLELSLSRFRSAVWSLRNCAAMMFTCLFKRLFGVRGLPVPASVFFQRYRRLKPLISKQLIDASRTSEMQAVYPALAILSKLQTASRTDETLAEYWEPIIELLGSSSWKIREIAARVVVSMTHIDSIRDVIHELIATLSLSNQNMVHGFALAINNLLNTLNEASQGDVMSSTVTRSLSVLERLIGSNECSETSVELFKIWKKLGGKGRLVKFNDLPKLRYLNSSVAKFEALQAIDSPELVEKYAHGWSDVLRTLPADKWSYKLANVVFNNSEELPDLRSYCIRVLSESHRASEFADLAEPLLDPKLPSCIQQEALVLAAQIADLDSNKVAHSKWLAVLLKFSADDSPVESRRSAVLAIGRRLKSKGSQCRVDDELLYALFKLLSDEEEDIRVKAAEASSSYMKRTIPQAAPQCEKDILGLISPDFITTKLSERLIEDSKNARSRFELPHSEIFVVEKESLYRDEVRNIQIQGQFCKADSKSMCLANEARRVLSGLDFEIPLQASSSSELMEIRARIDALSG